MLTTGDEHVSDLDRRPRPRGHQGPAAGDLGERRLLARSRRDDPIIAERLCDAADLRAGWRVLDVAGGSGNTALAAARCGCEVVSASTTCPRCSSAARQRAAAEGLDVETVEGDAEALPFPDASFDAVCRCSA